MPIKLTPDIQVRRDDKGVVRQMSHPNRPYRAATTSLAAAGIAPKPVTPRAVAEEYLRDASDVFQFAPNMTSNFAAQLSASSTSAGVELRFKEEKAMENAITVSYDQTALGLPIWGAGVSVRVNGGDMGVTGSHNAAHYDVQVTAPPPGAAYLPHSMAPQSVAKLLGVSTPAELTVNATRALVYAYHAEERFDPQLTVHESPNDWTGVTGKNTPSLPSLPLPPLSENIVEGKHYVVTEVLFTLPREGWGPVNWRAFVEPTSGDVLYLRALVSCARGRVFRTDPVSLSGALHSAATAPAILDPIATIEPLLGLAPPGGGQSVQRLGGEFVRLVNVQAPNQPMPAEPAPHDFIYSCNTPNFAACSAYHHCDGFFRLLQGMGIDVASYFNNTDFPIRVDPHALQANVNAQCNGNVTGNGIGPVVFGVAAPNSNFGIAADVRVVIHEFGHGVLWDHVDSPNFGFAHSPGDSLAVILHDPVSRAPDRFETFPFMKQSAGLSRRHDRQVAEGWAWGGPPHIDDRQYGSEQILSTTLFRVYRAAGGDSADRAERAFASRYVSYLILKGVSLLQFTTRDPDVYVGALTEADATTGDFEGHPGGALSKVFRWSFEQQGLYQPAGAAQPVFQVGAPPDVDVYIDDGRHGDYMPFLQDFQGNAEIWNRTLADAGTTHQTPAVGVQSFLYVRVRNRGTTTAREVVVRGFQGKTAAATTWPTDWQPLAPAQLPAQDIPAGGSVVVGPIAFTARFAEEKVLFSASALGDRSNLETVTAGPIANARLVQLDNNIAQRTL